jgi:hypothetical protein
VSGAVDEFVSCTKLYQNTPLLQELMVEVIKSDRGEDLLPLVVESARNCHSQDNVQLQLLLAYATVGNVNLLKKFVKVKLKMADVGLNGNVAILTQRI